jgi:hypothetical protein
MWCTENCELRNEPAYLAKIASTTIKTIIGILPCFIPIENKITHKRLQYEREKQDEFRRNASAWGKKGGGNPNFKKRVNKPNPSKGDFKGMYKGDVNSPSPSPSLKIKNSLKRIEQLVAQEIPIYGNENINKMLTALKDKIGIQAFVDSSIERNMAKHCVNLIGKIGKEEFVRRLDLLLADQFHYKNCNKIKYVYNNIKGFIDQQPKINNRIIIKK